MKMSKDWAQLIQDRMQIMYFGPEDLTPSYFIGGVWHKEEEMQHWQEGIDMIYRLTKSGLLYVDRIDPSDEDLQRLYVDISSNSPFGPDVGIWMFHDLGLTERGEELMRKHHVDNNDQELNQPFIEEMELIFEEAGVLETTAPLLPIAAGLQQRT